MVLIRYSRTGYAISDFRLKVFTNQVKKAIKKEVDVTFRISSSIFITAIRLEIAKGNIDFNKIKFQYKNKKFQANEYGAIMDWPKGFCDIENDMCEKILMIAMEKRKNARRSNKKSS